MNRVNGEEREGSVNGEEGEIEKGKCIIHVHVHTHVQNAHATYTKPIPLLKFKVRFQLYTVVQ